METNSYVILIANFMRREHLGELALDRTILLKGILEINKL
jgi:hypothetical protein